MIKGILQSYHGNSDQSLELQAIRFDLKTNLEGKARIVDKQCLLEMVEAHEDPKAGP
jgi:hypothetical protein